MGVDNARIEIDGPEVPLLDGSAQLWVEAIASVGLVSQSVPSHGEHSGSHLQEPIWCIRAMPLSLLPAPEARFTASTSTSSNWQPVAQLVAALSL